MRPDGWGGSLDSGWSEDWVHTGPQAGHRPRPPGPVAHLTGSQAQTGWGPDTPGRLSHQFSWWRDAPVSTAPHAPPSTQCHRALTWHTQVPFPSMPSRQVLVAAAWGLSTAGALCRPTHT